VEELKLGRAIHLYAEFAMKLAFLPFSYLGAAGLSLQQNEEGEMSSPGTCEACTLINISATTGTSDSLTGFTTRSNQKKQTEMCLTQFAKANLELIDAQAHPCIQLTI